MSVVKIVLINVEESASNGMYRQKYQNNLFDLIFFIFFLSSPFIYLFLNKSFFKNKHNLCCLMSLLSNDGKISFKFL